MLAELLERDHGQQARPGPSPGDRTERRRGLADLLAVAAGELLPNRLDHLPLARHHFQRPRHVLAEFAQAIAAAAFTSGRRIDHHPLARKVLGEGLALGALAGKSEHFLSSSPRARSAASSSSVASASSSSNVSVNCSISREERSDRCP